MTNNFWNWKNIATFVAGGIITILAIVGVIYAIIVEPGDLGLRIRDGHELKWDKNDLPISCVYKNVDEKLLFAYDYSVLRILNSTLGFDTYMKCVEWQFEKEPPQNSLLFLKYRNTGKVGAETTIYYDKRTGKIRGLKIEVEKNIEPKMLLRVITHELLHGLGLEHDREQTVMFGEPKSYQTDIKISKKDIKLLQKIYK